MTLVERAGPAGLGGVCLQVGCIPSKALIELADAAQRTRDLRAAGLDADGVARLARALPGLARRAVRRPRARRRPSCSRPAACASCTARRASTAPTASRCARPSDGVAFFEFEHAIVATGSRPVALPGLPFDGERVLDSTGALALTAVPDSVAVVGAGYIGLELGTALAKLGARVTVVEALDRVLPTVDESLTAPVRASACARWASTCAWRRPRSASRTARSWSTGPAARTASRPSA